MHIGLIGGIGPAATDFYYRSLINRAQELERDLELTIAHADKTTLVHNLINNLKADQCAIYHRLTERLKKAGAECVVVTSIAGHFCIDEFTPSSQLPVIDLTKSLAAWIIEKKMKRIGIIGTETVMSSGMYGKLSSVEVLPPAGDQLSQVHDAYVALAKSGQSNAELRNVFVEAGEALMSAGAEAVLLGGTDLNLAFQDDKAPFPLIDGAAIHVEEIAKKI